MRIEYDNKCTVTCTDNDKVLEVEVSGFKKEQFVDVWMAQDKMKMVWNGRTYVGNKIGLEFTTPGPKEFIIKKGRGF